MGGCLLTGGWDRGVGDELTCWRGEGVVHGYRRGDGRGGRMIEEKEMDIQTIKACHMILLDRCLLRQLFPVWPQALLVSPSSGIL